MTFEARTVLLNGPPGAGKTTVAARLRERFAGTGRLAVVEHDDFALMAGAPAAGEAAERISTVGLHALVAAARAFAQSGASVLVVVNYGRARKELLEQLLGPAPVQQVLLLPPWEVCQARVHDRLTSASPLRLPDIGPDARREFYDDLRAMAGEGEFDDVIGSSRAGIEVADTLVARHLNLLRGRS